MEWLRWIPGGEVISWGALIAGGGALLRLLPRAARWCVGLLIANVRLALVIRERDVLRETVNRLLEERERMERSPTSDPAPLLGSSPGSSASTSDRTPRR